MLYQCQPQLHHPNVLERNGGQEKLDRMAASIVLYSTSIAMKSSQCRTGRQGRRWLWLAAALSLLLPVVGMAQIRTAWQMYTNGGLVCFPSQLLTQTDTNA